MKLSHEAYDQVSVFTLQGDLNADAVDLLRREVQQRLEKDARDVVLDMASVDLIDSQGLEALLWLQDKCGERLGQVRLAAANETIEKVLTLTRLAGRFDRHADVEAAIKSLR